MTNNKTIAVHKTNRVPSPYLCEPKLPYHTTIIAGMPIINNKKNPRCCFRLFVLRLLFVFVIVMSTQPTTATAWQAPTTTSTNVAAAATCWLVVDFDGTCTETDTTPLLPQLAAVLAGEPVSSRMQAFGSLEAQFFELYSQAKQKCAARAMTTTLHQVLDALDEPSNVVTEQVSASRVLQGLECASANQIHQVLSCNSNPLQVILRDKCLTVLQRALLSDYRLAVLSINWCPALIEACLVEPLQQQQQQQQRRRQGTPSDIPIWSNAVQDAGIVDLQVPGALAKQAKIRALQQEQQVVVYVGDSVTDLAALMQADVGILFQTESQSAVRLCEQFGQTLHPLRERARILATAQQDESPIIWTVQTWDEIGQFLEQ